MAMQPKDLLKPWKSKITRIEQMWMQNCSTNFFLWMLGYFAATPTLVTSFLAPDCLDYTADRVRPGHKRRRKGVLSAGELSSPLGADGKGEGWVGYKLLAGAQRIGFYLTVIDATLDWVIHGTSFAYQLNGCKDPNQGFASLYMQNQVPFLLPARSGAIAHWHLEERHIFTTAGAGIRSPKGHAAGAGFNLDQIPDGFLPLQDCTFSARLIDVATGWTGPWQDPRKDDAGNNVYTYFNPIAGAADESNFFMVEIEKSFGVMYVNGTFYASGLNLEGVTKSACGASIGGF